MYIALEGVDTAGKSTQIEHLRSLYAQALFTKEPGGTKAGELMRNLLLEGMLSSKKAELLLFLADRAEHVERIIKPNLDRLIISDRSAISGVAYALAQGDIDQKVVVDLHHFATERIYPDAVLFLRLSKEELARRLASKSQDGIERRGVEYLLSIQKQIQNAAKLLDVKLISIDATQDAKSITEEIVRHIDSLKST